MPRRSRERSSSVSIRVRDALRRGHLRLVVEIRGLLEIRIKLYYVYRRPTTIHYARRRNNVERPYVDARVEAMYPRRLIEHRFCKTSKPTYVRATVAARYPERVVGLYAAFHEKVDRRRRPMARALHVTVSAMERVVKLLVKLTMDGLTRIVKIADGWRDARIEYEVVGPHVAVVLRGTIARIYAAVVGRREEYYRGTIRHCSVYAIVKGLRYEGPPSVWYWWHARWKACGNICDGYHGVLRGVCYSMCADVISTADPRSVEYLWPRAAEKVREWMARIMG